MMPKPAMVGQEATFCIENKSFIVGSMSLRINKSVSISLKGAISHLLAFTKALSLSCFFKLAKKILQHTSGTCCFNETIFCCKMILKVFCTSTNRIIF